MASYGTLLNSAGKPIPFQKFKLGDDKVLVKAVYKAANQKTSYTTFTAGSLVILKPSTTDGALPEISNYVTVNSVGYIVGLVLQACTTANEGGVVDVLIEGTFDEARFHHITGTTDAIGDYLRILVDDSDDCITGEATVGAANNSCLARESTPTAPSTASVAVLLETVLTDVATADCYVKVRMLGYSPVVPATV